MKDSTNALVTLSARNAMLVVVHPHNNECCSVNGKGTAETEAAIDRIVQIVPRFRAAGMPVRFTFAAAAHNDAFKAFGGVHPKIAALITKDDRLHQEYNANAYVSASFRAELMAGLPRHHFLVGFNLSDCVSKTAIGGMHDKDLRVQSMTILSDAAADRADIAMDQMRDDSGIGESLISAMARASGVEKTRSTIVMARLGIAA